MISPASKRRSVLLIGCGNMGSAIALALQHTAENLDLTVIDPDEARARQILGSQNDIKVVNDSAALGSAQFEACILAVKPTSALETLVNTQQNLQSSLVISIAAGVPLAKLQQGVTDRARVARVMPNLAALVRKSITVGYAKDGIATEDRLLVEALFGAIGRFHWLKSEDEIDLATAVTGSGPGYVFSFVQHLQQAAERVGFSKETADLFARQIIVGAAGLVDEDPRSPLELKHAVASPGGTTAAGLAVFEQAEAMPRILNKTVAAAAVRAKELATEQS
ncbi:Pyrroline-5-carboxylate reductase [Ensifer sp. M14]|uniref:pyrroline-5-carboxylate reductase n=1 Tax=Ensifer sp. M14 TaxID=2203782 RepID=UPI000E1D3033|nr:pyrroline-5-carboxylate reductase [Ensifer sp. M14]RDL50361.1 Pyrroline-5-carboxylate reductase [Ensifer sp. M14]